MTNNSVAGRRTNVQKAALAFGVLFVLIGLLGFLPGITSNYDNLTGAGHVAEGHNASLLGLFEVSVLHNLVHLLFGAVLIWASRRVDSSRSALIASGVLYALLFLYGLFVGHKSDANFLPVNGADNVLHLLLAAGLTAAGYLLTRNRRDAVGESVL